MQVSNYPQVTISFAARRIAALIAAKKYSVNTVLLGKPGIGKTQIIEQTVRGLKDSKGNPYTLAALTFGTCVAEDASGIPMKDPVSGQIVRLPLGPIKLACERACVLLLDESTRCDKAKQGALMTGLSERRFGDFLLHPETIVVLLGNEPDSAGVFSLIDALLNRCAVFRVVADFDAFIAYLKGYGTGTTNALAQDYALTAAGRRDLVALDPPPGYSATGALWASPREIVLGLDDIAALYDAGPGIFSQEEIHATLASHISSITAAAWLTLRRLRDQLPTRAEIEATPLAAKVPTNGDTAIAALGLLGEVASGKQNASIWPYLDRWDKGHAEARTVAIRSFMGKVPTDPKVLPVFQKLVGSIGRAYR